jgi:hypothetical protein
VDKLYIIVLFKIIIKFDLFLYFCIYFYSIALSFWIFLYSIDYIVE